MNRVYVLSALTLTVLLTLSSVAAMGLGAMLNEPPPVVTGFYDCDGKFCFYGIVPGETSTQIADIVMRVQNYQPADSNYGWSNAYIQRNPTGNCKVDIFYDGKTNIVDDFFFSACANVHVGDVMGVIGVPDRIDLGRFDYNNGKFQILLPEIPDSHSDRTCPETSTPFAQVRFLRLTDTEWANAMPYAYSWHGFMSYWQYSRRFGLLDCKALSEVPG